VKVLGVFPTYGQFDYCRRAVESFLATVPGAEALVVDDASPDWPGAKAWAAWPEVRRYRFARHDRNLTRSWNYGLSQARALGAEFCALVNSDVICPKGWWEPIEWALTQGGVDLAGPATNAPGPSAFQRVERHLDREDGYLLTDEPGYLAKVQKRLARRNKGKVVRGSVNGFFLVAKTATWWAGAINRHQVFDPRKKLTGNEDELQRRWKRAGLMTACVPASWVFHFRGVSRDKRGHGSFRRVKE
jgi:glycosyltransferase involved in cell wall biosynthesis